MDQQVLNAVPRAQTTKGELNKSRAQGQIPAVIYGGGGAATHIFLDEKEFLKVASGISESTILGIDVNGKRTRAFVKARQRNSLSTKIIHIDFLEVVSGRLIRARVPLHLIGVPIGVREGGILENPAHEIEVECDPDNLPEKIDIDVAGLQANHSIHVREIPAIDKVKVLSSPELVVAVVKFVKEEIVVAPVEAVVPVEGAPGAVPAAGVVAAPGAVPAPGAATAAPVKKEEKK
jgi:large subunit ribosomal protein L25